MTATNLLVGVAISAALHLAIVFALLGVQGSGAVNQPADGPLPLHLAMFEPSLEVQPELEGSGIGNGEPVQPRLEERPSADQIPSEPLAPVEEIQPAEQIVAAPPQPVVVPKARKSPKPSRRDPIVEPGRISDALPKRKPKPNPEPVKAGEARASASPASVAEATGPNTGSVDVKASRLESKHALQRAALQKAYLATLTLRIDAAKRYPRQARRRGESGRVLISFVIERDGRLRDLRVAESSGSARLDEAALDTVRRLDPYEPIPRQLARDTWRISVPIVFRLRRG